MYWRIMNVPVAVAAGGMISAVTPVLKSGALSVFPGHEEVGTSFASIKLRKNVSARLAASRSRSIVFPSAEIHLAFAW